MHRLAGCLLLLLEATAVNGATCNWTGGGGGNTSWSSAANWNNCGGAHALPADGDTVVFGSSSDSTNDLAGLDLTHLQFNTSTGTIGGNAVTLSQGATMSGSFLSALSFGPDITLLADAQAIQSSGTAAVLGLTGTLDLNGHDVTFNGNAIVAMSGPVVGTGGIVKSGTGTLTLSGANTYSGATTISAGIVEAAGATPFGSLTAATIVASGATLKLNGSDTSEAVTVGGDGVGNGGAIALELGSSVLRGEVTLSADTRVDTAASTQLTMTGALNGAFALTKSGAGQLRLLNPNAYAGAATVESGTLRADGEVGAVAVSATADLSGSGIIDGAIALASGGTLSPGGTIGTLTAASLNWEGGATLVFELGAAAASSDHLVLAGALIRNAGTGFTFELHDAATPPHVGTQYTLVSYGSTNFVLADFNVVYLGTGPSASMTGALKFNGTSLQYTPTAVVSDLVFRNGFD